LPGAVAGLGVHGTVIPLHDRAGEDDRVVACTAELEARARRVGDRAVLAVHRISKDDHLLRARAPAELIDDDLLAQAADWIEWVLKLGEGQESSILCAARHVRFRR